ncbi:YaiO family outer membrane beta-barrel protein [Labilibaculum sp. K2S]|uniref:YaiO family outer membrane beta-barrel protein n=1 Tax=Labilibaculum sp. K2S TaxID=3056386 RepID=UPI0025A382F9|nr:YaiO family outer membrane beta-barrel protein [Labilibaculum sp. K2S]MDM8161854.1 YaiO family outer membrane beta-barrel protein [Labilibaculum sp. K2S]
MYLENMIQNRLYFCSLKARSIQKFIGNRSIWRGIILLLLINIFSEKIHAQTDYTSDELFQQARSVAFDQKDYPKAMSLVFKALGMSPDYSDVRIFLGRLYTWSDKYDLAKESFLYVLKQNPDYEDATLAITDLEYWNDHYDSALLFCNNGLQYHPNSEELLLKKGKILNALRRYKEAYSVVTDLIEKYPKNESARSLQQAIRFDSALNKVSLSHDFSWFDGNYGDYLHKSPWHIIAVDYSRYAGIGSVIARLNYGNRFGNKAFQFEMDAYPRLFKNLSAYVNFGISDQSAVFPRHRAGMSLYASLPHSYEAEAGFRFLHFSNSTWIYVGSVSKYYKNFLFNARVYIVPDKQKISHSYSFTTRYYFGGADDYWKFGVGYGLSPDDAGSAQSFASDYRLRSVQFSAGYRKSITKFDVISLSMSVINQEFRKDTFGNRINTSVTYIRKF